MVLTADEESKGVECARFLAGAKRCVSFDRTASSWSSQRTLGSFGDIALTSNSCVTVHGRQARSSTGKGLNANIKLIPFLTELRRILAAKCGKLRMRAPFWVRCSPKCLEREHTD